MILLSFWLWTNLLSFYILWFFLSTHKPLADPTWTPLWETLIQTIYICIDRHLIATWIVLNDQAQYKQKSMKWHKSNISKTSKNSQINKINNQTQNQVKTITKWKKKGNESKSKKTADYKTGKTPNWHQRNRWPKNENVLNIYTVLSLTSFSVFFSFMHRPQYKLKVKISSE